jgi:cell division protein FtsW (lipid II flippase)
MRLRILAVLAVVALVSAPIAWNFALRDYQKSRIETFLDPSQDARGAGYQQIQAQITVGSGGLWGKGYRKGTQGQLRFLPAPITTSFFRAGGGTGFAECLRWPVSLVIWRFDRGGRFVATGWRLFAAACWPALWFQVIYNITIQGLAPERFDAAAVELWRVVDDRHAGELRPDHQRAHAPFY